jgi:hypothetical protein
VLWVSDETPAPTVGERSADFGGMTGAVVHQPLVAVSTPNVSDPDGWKAGELTSAAQTALQQAFQDKFKDVTNCASPEAAPAAMPYTAEQINFFDVETSSRGWTLATVHLDGYGCDGPFDDTAFAPQSYAVSPDGKAVHLGESLMRVGTGDYDADGKSEVVFAVGVYNQGGYQLRYNDFADSAAFVFSYH